MLGLVPRATVQSWQWCVSLIVDDNLAARTAKASVRLDIQLYLRLVSLITKSRLHDFIH